MIVPIWGVLLAAGAILVLIHVALGKRNSIRGHNYGVQVQDSKVEGSIAQRSTVHVETTHAEGGSRPLVILGIVLALMGILEKVTGILGNLTKSS